MCSVILNAAVHHQSTPFGRVGPRGLQHPVGAIAWIFTTQLSNAFLVQASFPDMEWRTEDCKGISPMMRPRTWMEIYVRESAGVPGTRISARTYSIRFKRPPILLCWPSRLGLPCVCGQYHQLHQSIKAMLLMCYFHMPGIFHNHNGIQ